MDGRIGSGTLQAVHTVGSARAAGLLGTGAPGAQPRVVRMGRALSCTKTLARPYGAVNSAVPVLLAYVPSTSVLAVVAAENLPGP